jgi:hypothetical protein
VDKDDRFAGADDPIRGRRPVDQKLPNLHDDQFGSTSRAVRRYAETVLPLWLNPHA